jgi:hypothetical protein
MAAKIMSASLSRTQEIILATLKNQIEGFEKFIEEFVAENNNKAMQSPTAIITLGEDIIAMMRSDPSLVTEENAAMVNTFYTEWVNVILTAKDDKDKFFKVFNQADPSVLFPFFRAQLSVFKENSARELYDRALDALNTQCPHRESICSTLMNTLVRRLMRDRFVSYPLLIGSPGTGKTEIARQLGMAMTAIGIRTNVVVQSMTDSNGQVNSNQVEMKLQGTSAGWSNAKSGSMYKGCSGRDIDLCLVVLDEADKHDNCYDKMVEWLDPNQLLQDHFVSDLWGAMDMRHKVVFVLTANDEKPLNKGLNDPLWSRLAPLQVADYTKQQLEDLLTTLAERNYLAPNYYHPLKQKDYREIAVGLVAKHWSEGLSFRTYLDRVGAQAFARSLFLPTLEPKQSKLTKQRKIGFDLGDAKHGIGDVKRQDINNGQRREKCTHRLT